MTYTTKESIQANLPAPANIDWDGDIALVLVFVTGGSDLGTRVMVDSPSEAYDLKYAMATGGLYHGLRVAAFIR